MTEPEARAIRSQLEAEGKHVTLFHMVGEGDDVKVLIQSNQAELYRSPHFRPKFQEDYPGYRFNERHYYQGAQFRRYEDNWDLRSLY